MENTKIENAVQELVNIQSQCQELIDRIREIEKEIEQNNESKFERMLQDKTYYRNCFVNGMASVSTELEEYTRIDDNCFDNNNYFKTPDDIYFDEHNEARDEQEVEEDLGYAEKEYDL